MPAPVRRRGHEIPVEGDHLTSAEARLEHALYLINDWRPGDYRVEVVFTGWQKLMADAAIAERIHRLARNGSGKLWARIRGTTVMEAANACREYRTVTAAIMAGDTFTVDDTESNQLGYPYGLVVHPGHQIAGLADVRPIDRSDVAAALRRAADQLAPDDSRCPLCVGGRVVDTGGWPRHLLTEHADLIGARALAAKQ